MLLASAGRTVRRAAGRFAKRKGLLTSSPARRAHRFLSVFFPVPGYSDYFARVVAFYEIVRALEKHSVPGDLVECGVGMGGSLVMIGSFADRLGLDRRLIGFDSFRGFPEPSPKDASDRQARKADWSGTSPRHVREHFDRMGLTGYRDRHLTLVEGYLKATLPAASDIKSIALLNLDVDLYDGYKVALQILGPRVEGIIVYDEYANPKWPGATLAIDESLPSLDHAFFYSELVDGYFSLPNKRVSDGFGREIVSALGGRRREIPGDNSLRTSAAGGHR